MGNEAMFHIYFYRRKKTWPGAATVFGEQRRVSIWIERILILDLLRKCFAELKKK